MSGSLFLYVIYRANISSPPDGCPAPTSPLLVVDELHVLPDAVIHIELLYSVGFAIFFDDTPTRSMFDRILRG